MAVLDQARAAFPEVFGVDAEIKPLTFAADLELATALAISRDRVSNLMVWWTQQPAYLAALEQHKNRRWRLDGSYLTLQSPRPPPHLRRQLKTPGVPTTPEDIARREANLRVCAERFPALFGAQVRPMAIGAGALLREALGISETEGIHLLRWWVTQRPYCEAVAEPESKRYNLDGSIADDVSEAHRQDARGQLARLRGERPTKRPSARRRRRKPRRPRARRSMVSDTTHLCLGLAKARIARIANRSWTFACVRPMHASSTIRPVLLDRRGNMVHLGGIRDRGNGCQAKGEERRANDVCHRNLNLSSGEMSGSTPHMDICGSRDNPDLADWIYAASAEMG